MKLHVFSLFFLCVPTLAHAATATLRWADMSDNETGFAIEQRSQNPVGTWSEITRVAPDTTTYADTLSAGDSVCYRVLAFNADGNSDYSNEACVSVPTTEPVPIIPEPVPASLEPPILSYSTCCVSATEPKGVAVITWVVPPSGVGMHLERRLRNATAKWERVVGPIAAEGLWHEHGVNLSSPWCWRAVFADKTQDTALSNRVCSND